MSEPPELTIGETARRSGLSAPTLRYYERRGLIRSTRSSGNQRRYPRRPCVAWRSSQLPSASG